MSENLYSLANGHNVQACGTCWNLTAIADTNGRPLSNSIIVKVNDLCPHEKNEMYCEPVGSQARNGMESPALHKSRNAISGRRRSRFRVISDRVRSGSSETSYTAHRTSDIDTAILGVCRQIHREACHVLYSMHTFDFDIDVESIVPFFRDLTPAALASVESIRFVKRALPYCKEFDRFEWRSACAFLASQMRLRRVNLTVVGGRPGPVWGAPVGEWESQAPWEFDDFNHVMQSERMEWARQVTSIRGLRALVVVSALEHCPPPRSKDMVFFANFTASIETGFSAYLNSVMVDESSRR
ncbi:MAG: hypothetical protein Q9182_007361 [Xanthomendoza sp. 2 TL-2023]